MWAVGPGVERGPPAWVRAHSVTPPAGERPGRLTARGEGRHRGPMRTMMFLALFLAACGDDGGGGVDAPLGGDGAVAFDAGGALVPAPGTQAIPFSWPDTEPNDSPSQAVPVGTSLSPGEATWFDGTLDSGSLGGDDRADFFVFASSPEGGNFHAGPCWNSADAPNLMDFFVYEVVDGHVGATLATSADAEPGCENLAGAADVAMEPSTVYLLELRAVGTGNPVTVYAA